MTTAAARAGDLGASVSGDDIIGTADDGVVITRSLLTKYDVPCPRYTSYPPADRFSTSFGESDFRAAVERAGARVDAPLSLYVHLPFCATMCAYCGCNVVISKSEEKRTAYLDRVLQEIDRVALALDDRKIVDEIHLGGGTPSSYPPDEIARLLAHIEDRFFVRTGAEIAMEVDPRRASQEMIVELSEVGINRLSMGVQDFDPEVQRAIGRVQSAASTEAVLAGARQGRMRSANIDLIYGLPLQTRERFAKTVAHTIALAPDRIALFSFAYVPQSRPTQKRINASDLPSSIEKMRLFLDARRAFLDAGYVAIGMDHFARPDDPLAVAARDKKLTRSFQGYGVHRSADIVGVGMSAISDVGGAYAQNESRLPDYERRLDRGDIPVARGITLSLDDERRRFAIQELMCNFVIDESRVRERYDVGFDAFGDALERMQGACDDGLAVITDGRIEVTKLGRFFVRNVASAFDNGLIAGATVPYARAV
jgi:oxygen-independent coproporphyrinogen-3 oxidase